MALCVSMRSTAAPPCVAGEARKSMTARWVSGDTTALPSACAIQRAARATVGAIRASTSATRSAVLMAVSGFREIESMPRSTSHAAKSG